MMTQTTTSKFTFEKPLLLSDFSKRLKIDPGEIIKHFFINGRITNLNTVLSKEDCKSLCDSLNIIFEEGEEQDKSMDLFEEYTHFLDVEDQNLFISKIPIVTIMGHVDHGKTTLLDRIRGSSIASSEFGGITQHIGAYQVEKNGKKITFIDTPGHQAFSKLRSRGANVTDIVVLVIAADDGIKPQTVEAIKHALHAKVKVIVFINKIDKESKKINSLKHSLMEHDLVLEEFGGDVLCVQGSALTGAGIDELLEAILIVADMENMKTVTVNPAVGTIIESKMEKSLGATATVLLSRGNIKCGDYLIMRSSICKVKSMSDTHGKSIKSLDPCCPAKIAGFKNIPEAGDKFLSFDHMNEGDAKKFFKKLQEIEKQKDLIVLNKNKNISDLNFIIRCDVSGSLEAILDISYSHGIPVTFSGIGVVTDSDLQLASISNSVIINFNQKIPSDIQSRARDMKIIIKNYRSVYEMEEEMEEMIKNNRIIEYEEEVLGKAEVVMLWKHSKVGTIAGCKVVSGKISKTDKIRVIRNSEVLFTSTIKSFKTEGYEIKECLENQECGIVVNNWNDIKPNDVIEAFCLVEKADV